MPAESKTKLSSGKWILIIALGVVLGLTLWTVGNAILGEWQKSRREREIAGFKADLERRGAEDSKRVHAWSEIMLDAEVRKEDQHMIGGTAPARTDGTLSSRIESHPEYKRRLQEIGSSAMRKELIDELLTRKEVSVNRMKNDIRRPNEWRWYQDVDNLLKELGVDGN